MNKVAAVIVAGGSGKRMGGTIKKQYILLENKEVFAHTIEVFEQFNKIDEIILVVGQDDITKVEQDIIQKYHFKKVKQVVAGGAERQDSVYNGLCATSKEIEYVMIHDGARPFIKEEILEHALEATIKKKATVVAVPVKDTIKIVSKDTLEVEETPKREKLWSVQTPQSFEKELLMEAYDFAKREKLAVTDDSMIMEAYGKKVYVVMGDYTNIKITTPEDLILGESILKQKR